MGNCQNCAGGCGGCSHAGSLTITPPEADFLRLLGEVAFLPVARTMGDTTPVYLEDDRLSREEYSNLLLTLEKKGLISLDYSIPLKGMSPERYAGFPILGSMALTERGQRVLELMEIQGWEDE